MQLAGKSVVILVANGVDEPQLTEIQRALSKEGARVSTVAPEQGLVNSWHGDAWGHYHPVDRMIGEVLGSDHDMLILPGGERSTDKLKENLHTRRLVNHFLDANKPISAIAEGVGLLSLGTRIAARSVAAPKALQPQLEQAGALIDQDDMMLDNNVLTMVGPEPTAWVAETIALAIDSELVRKAA
jgi:protease I